MSTRHDRIVALVARINAQLAGTTPARYIPCERCGRVVRLNTTGTKRAHKCPHNYRCATTYRVRTRVTEIVCPRCREEVAARIPEEK